VLRAPLRRGRTRRPPLSPWLARRRTPLPMPPPPTESARRPAGVRADGARPAARNADFFAQRRGRPPGRIAWRCWRSVSAVSASPSRSLATSTMFPDSTSIDKLSLSDAFACSGSPRNVAAIPRHMRQPARSAISPIYWVRTNDSSSSAVDFSWSPLTNSAYPMLRRMPAGPTAFPQSRCKEQVASLQACRPTPRTRPD
jgi:hypothetical protein